MDTGTPSPGSEPPAAPLGHDGAGDGRTVSVSHRPAKDAPPAPAAGGEHAGDCIGPYRLLAVIGEGGFGVVWIAERREPFVQRVAIKIIKAGMDSRAVIARFEQERQALALMDHPGIAKVIDGGVTPAALGARPYFVMQHVAGEPITAYCDRLRLPVRARLELFVKVCDAVQHSHMRGVIHRDIKPSNILVCPGEGGGPPRPVVIDFGVAKALSHSLSVRTVFTEQGLLIGTPEYMSPEQAEMSAAAVDTRTDVYSLGVVLYELLTGSVPFDLEKLRKAGYAAVQRIIREEEPPRPSTKITKLKDEGTTVAQARAVGPRELADQLRRELEWIPLKAIRKGRDERYISADRLAEDVQNYLAGRPLFAGPPSIAYRVSKWIGRNRAIAAGAAAVIAVAAVFGTLLAVQYRRTVSAENEAQQQAYEANIAASAGLLERNQVNEARRRLALCPSERRGWEWRHLWWLSQASDAHRDMGQPVLAVRSGRNGQSVVAAVSDDIVVLSPDLKSETDRWSWRTAADTSWRPRQLSADGKTVLCDTALGKQELIRKDGSRTQLKFTRTHLLADDLRFVCLERYAGSGQPLLLGVHAASDDALVTTFASDAFAESHDGSTILSFSGQSVEIVPLNGDGRRTYPLISSRRPPNLRWGRGGTDYVGRFTLATGGGEERAVFATGAVLNLKLGVWESEGDLDSSVALSGGAAFARLGPGGLTIGVASGAEQLTIQRPIRTGEVICDIDSSGRLVTTGNLTGELNCWWNLPAQLHWPFGPERWSSTSSASSLPYGRTIAIAHTDSSGTTSHALFVDAVDKRVLNAAQDPNMYSLSSAKDGYLAVSDGAFLRWDREGKPGASWKVTTPLFASGARLLTVLNIGGSPAVFASRQSGAFIARYAGETPQVLWDSGPIDSDPSVCVSDNGAALVFAADRIISIWENISSGAALAAPRQIALSDSPSQAQTVALDRSGQRIAVSTFDGRLWVSDPLTSRNATLHRCEGEDGAGIQRIIFTPDGTRILTDRGDSSLQVWDAGARRMLLTLSVPRRILSFQFPDAKDDAVLLLENGQLLDLRAPAPASPAQAPATR